ncbi:MAG: SulP family inorganic anion transporter [Bacteroidota bacterium]
MSDQNKFHPLKNLQFDLPAALVVFLVAVPLCLGIAKGSEVPPEHLLSGLIAGMIGGIIVGFLSGSPLGVSGPAAGLIPIVAGVISSHSFEGLLVAVFLAGIIQIAFGALRLGIIGYYFPNSVIRGMLAGIGLTIILKVLPDIFGLGKDFFKKFSWAPEEGQLHISELGSQFMENMNYSVLIISAISILLLIIWEQKFMKEIRLFQILQGSLIVVIVGIVLKIMFEGMDGIAPLTQEQVVNIGDISGFSSFIALFTFPFSEGFDFLLDPSIYMAAVTIALVASLETLLCVEATDKLDPFKRITPTNQELYAQGTGNVVSGLIGGLPITQVIVRSSANIQSGGRTKAAAIIHGFFLVLAVLLFSWLINLIPMASLSAILLIVGFKLAKPSNFKAMFDKGWDNFIPFIITIIVILAEDLLIGITVGLVIAFLFILYNNFRLPYFVDKDGNPDNNTIRLELSQDVTFLHKANMLKALQNIPEDSKLIIDGTKSINIDQDIKDIIEDFKVTAKNKNIVLELIGFHNVDVKNQVVELEKTIEEKFGAKA